jgi:iron complex outermembrane receptor protein
VQAESNGGAFGASLTFDKGYAGLSYGRTNSFYGTVAEPNVKIDMVNDRIDFSSELFDLNSAIKRIKFHMAYTDYQHQEINNGNIDTTFLNHGIEGTLEGAHTQIGHLVGVLGLQFQNTRFEALGTEAFIPSTYNTKEAFYIYEELPIDQLKLSAGARIDQVNIHSAGGPRFGSSMNREFAPKNLSAGALYHFNDQWSVETNLTHTERAPSQDALFANGAHIATHQYEIGKYGA